MSTPLIRKIILTCFILVPLLSSIISTVHLIDLFYLGNPSWIAITVAIAIEIGSIASFLTLSILSKLNKSIVWSMFILLFIMQIIGNTYFSYDWITDSMIKDPNWLNTFKEMMDFFIPDVELKTTKMILSMLIGIPIPLISVFLLKSVVDYIGIDTKVEPIEKEEGIILHKPIEYKEIKLEEKIQEEPKQEEILNMKEPDEIIEEPKQDLVEEIKIEEEPKEEITEIKPEVPEKLGGDIHSSQIK